MSAAITANCHCGAVTICIPYAPKFMQDCDCSLCRKSGALWGYYDPADVKIEGKTHSYRRTDYPEPAVSINFCVNCGATSHWHLTKQFIAKSGENKSMGVNMKLFESAELMGVELRFPDGKNWFGKGDYGFRRPPVIIGEDFAL